MPERELTWTKARASLNTGACVELAIDGDSVLMRNSRQPETEIRFTRAEIAAFFDGVRRHEFDDFAAH